ncbi:prenyltransferase/squalene oxidase repeat-containing protein [Streptomyces longispororuber]|uniref:prenyltransferase/squalene oxidase repeat-containing protein n=1 Tax=Streptomyces longispororuber TaxID=68230 RepID=UPI00167ED027|nr:prenyltransferase/squalene oxidase repeat-containing protein [Streptomyces longispororuber]
MTGSGRAPHPSPSPTGASPPTLTADIRAAHDLAVRHLLSLQRDDGSWEGEMVWNTMILSQYVIVRELVNRPVPKERHAAIVRHYETTVTGEGGWGLHPASGPSAYCTTLAHVALRLLGLPPGHPLCAGSAAWLAAQPGGALSVPTWGKFWLALLGLYDWRAVNPLPPEIFLLPHRVPFHPDRLYCHTRTIYQAMAYLYGARFTVRPRVAQALEGELFPGRRPRPADRARLGTDALYPPAPVLRAVFTCLTWYERAPMAGPRARALDRCLRRVRHEQQVTAEAGISPVSSLLNVLVLHAAGAGAEEVDRALAGLESWCWQDEERGIRYAGARSHSWDTAFALEALFASGPTAVAGRAAAAERAASFLIGAQLRGDVPDPWVTARASADGGWCFSEGTHRWPVSDCTAEAAASLLHTADATRGTEAPTSLPGPERLVRAHRFLLERQNRDGGFGTYEPRRGPRLLERLNPSEMFTNCVVEDSYIECTGSALVALAALRDHVPTPDRRAGDRAARRARRFLLSRQAPDGSWPAAWGVHRIYGTLFAVRGLLAAGLAPGHPGLERAARWLERVQREDGGWGEHHRGCVERRYVPDETSRPVQTAWALLALLGLRPAAAPAVERGLAWLCRHQRADGSWRQEAPAGVFFGSAMLDYRLYAAYFPLWALGVRLAGTQSVTEDDGACGSAAP